MHSGNYFRGANEPAAATQGSRPHNSRAVREMLAELLSHFEVFKRRIEREPLAPIKSESGK